MDFVSYLRVSTSKQERSGLGLAAQRASVRAFAEPADRIIGEFIETVSGRKDNRTQLHLAFQMCRQRNARLLIAKLDRFSRRVSFIANIMESDVQFVIADMPNATAFQLHIFAALAQEERRLISVRTKAALEQAKMRGVKLGKNGSVLAEANRMEAIARARVLLPSLPDNWETMSYSGLAKSLNSAGITTSQGTKFYPQTAKNLIKTLDRSQRYDRFEEQ